jgi:nuclear GTP-binding protein
MVINDFLRGKIPWYIPDPSWPERKGKVEDVGFEGREGRLGEMRKKDRPVSTEEDAESWDGLDVETDQEANDDDDVVSDDDDDVVSDDDDEGNDKEEDRIEDPRPPKKVRR